MPVAHAVESMSKREESLGSATPKAEGGPGGYRESISMNFNFVRFHQTLIVHSPMPEGCIFFEIAAIFLTRVAWHCQNSDQRLLYKTNCSNER